MVAEPTLLKTNAGAPNKANLSFAGCGFLGIYHVGVASCFREYAPHLVHDQISGASAGALVAAALLSGASLGDCTTYTLRIASQARCRALGPLHPSFHVVKYLREGLEEFLPNNAHEICNGRLNVSLTRVSDRKNVLVNEFESKDDLIQALMCSAFVPFYCGMVPPKYKGVRYVDGGLSINIPVLNDGTITVSPFAGESDICPTDTSSNDMHIFLANTSVQFTMGNLYRASHAFFPPHPEILSQMCKQGFEDALKYLQRNDLISCKHHLSIKSSIISSEPLDDLTDTESYVSEQEVPIEEMIEMDGTDEQYYYEDGDTVGIQIEEDETDCDYYCDEDDDGMCHLEGCEECQNRQHLALLDSLPDNVITALQAACDSVNKGVLAPIYNLRAYKVISLMAAPWLLPFDLVIVLAKRMYEWAPYMPSDMQWFIQEFAEIVKTFIEVVEHGRHSYSARFTCQLAITETDYNQDDIVHQPSTLSLSQQSKTSKANKQNHHYVPARQRNFNVGFAVDFKSHNKSPLRVMDDMRHQILDDKEHQHVKIQQLQTRQQGEKIQNLPPKLKSKPAEDTTVSDLESSKVKVSGEGDATNLDTSLYTNETYDTFTNCLHIANQMDSLLAFHYMDESNPNVMQITEIFALDESDQKTSDSSMGHGNVKERSKPSYSSDMRAKDIHMPSQTSKSKDSFVESTSVTLSSSELTWDNFIETKNELDSENGSGILHKPLLRSKAIVKGLQTEKIEEETNVE